MTTTMYARWRHVDERRQREAQASGDPVDVGNVVLRAAMAGMGTDFEWRRDGEKWEAMDVLAVAILAAPSRQGRAALLTGRAIRVRREYRQAPVFTELPAVLEELL